MIIIGEKINGSIPVVAKAIAERDAEFIKARAIAQANAGATFIDCCASVPEAEEVETLHWMIDCIQSVTDLPIAVDSPSADVLTQAQLSMSVVIVRTAFAQEHPQQVAQFMADLEASIAFANENVDAAAQEIADQGIIASAAVAKQALPSCRLVFVAGAEMQAQAAPLYEILFAANPASVGGTLPDAGYFYMQ